MAVTWLSVARQWVFSCSEHGACSIAVYRDYHTIKIAHWQFTEITRVVVDEEMKN